MSEESHTKQDGIMEGEGNFVSGYINRVSKISMGEIDLVCRISGLILFLIGIILYSILYFDFVTIITINMTMVISFIFVGLIALVDTDNTLLFILVLILSPLLILITLLKFFYNIINKNSNIYN